MKTKFIWLIISCLMVAALVLASCAPAVVEEKKATVVTKEPEKKAEKVEEVVEAKTKYGGIVNMSVDWEVTSFDMLDAIWTAKAVEAYTHSALIEGDWWVDRDVCDFKYHWDHKNREDVWAGMLAESWEQVDPLTILWYIRKGVRWQNKPPVNGREFVAEDIKLHFERLLTGPRYQQHKLQNIKEITCPDKYTVKMTLKVPDYTSLREISIEKVYAHELWETYGNLRDWRTCIGTGPFTLEDFFMSSSMTFKTNPDYWEKDPDGNRLPYIDGIKMLIIVDPATKIAALQTGKLDRAIGIPWQQKPALAASAPELQWGRHIQDGAFSFWLKTTKAPFDDVRVRQALTMAVDFKDLADTIHEPGASDPLSWPASSKWTGIYVPYDELPDNVKKVRTYNPEAAKALLTEAGYPNGFDATVQYQAFGEWAFGQDGLELIAKYFEDIGVNLHLEPVDSGTMASLKYAPFPYKDILGTIGGQEDPYLLIDGKFICGAPWNRAIWCDPMGYVDETFEKIRVETNYDKRNLMYKDLFLYVTEQCPDITLPIGIKYVAWWPWLKGYSGEFSVNFWCGGIFKYVWLDTDLREAMTGK